MSIEPDLDHVSFAVHDAAAWGRRLRRELGATPVAGEVLPDFRYLLLHVGTEAAGGRVEFIEPVGEGGFLSRFLEARGEGPHHLTFVVPDLPRAIEDVVAWGGRVVGEDLDHAPWREAFVMPDARHRTVLQLAQTDRSFPSRRELLASQARDSSTLPSNRGATDPDWWTGLWDEPPGSTAVARDVHLRVTDLERSSTLFGGVLGGRAEPLPDGVRFRWPSGTLHLHPHERAGVVRVDIDQEDPGPGLRIGSTRLGGPEHDPV